MTGNQDDIPPAFRRRGTRTPAYVGMNDDQVMWTAANALRMVQMLPVGSRPRAEQWKEFDAAMGELSSRAVASALEKIHGYERELAEAEPPTDGNSSAG